MVFSCFGVMMPYPSITPAEAIATIDAWELAPGDWLECRAPLAALYKEPMYQENLQKVARVADREAWEIEQGVLEYMTHYQHALPEERGILQNEEHALMFAINERLGEQNHHLHVQTCVKCGKHMVQDRLIAIALSMGGVMLIVPAILVLASFYIEEYLEGVGAEFLPFIALIPILLFVYFYLRAVKKGYQGDTCSKCRGKG